MAFDLANYDKLRNPEISLEIGRAFRPFQQLMAVLPSSSKTLLPECYQGLFGTESPIAHFYPRKFVVDMDGVKVPWGGMTLSFACIFWGTMIFPFTWSRWESSPTPRIPFIDPTGLLSAMDGVTGKPPLSLAEKRRDEFRGANSFECLGRRTRLAFFLGSVKVFWNTSSRWSQKQLANFFFSIACLASGQ